MSFNSTSPTNYGFEGDPLLEAYMNAKFSEEISEKMKVPKRIIMSNSHEMESDNHEILNGNQMNSWNYYDKLDMTVPDRIVVIGQDQHLGELKFIVLLSRLPHSRFHYARFIYILSFLSDSPENIGALIKNNDFPSSRSIFHREITHSENWKFSFCPLTPLTKQNSSSFSLAPLITHLTSPNISNDLLMN